MGHPTLFITGMQRSGTTLLEKLLSSHTEVSLLSQPFPFLFLQIKREFFRSIGQTPPTYALGPLFRETRYAPKDLARFLAGHVVTRPALEEAFATMEGFSGQYTRFDAGRLQETFDDFRPGDLASTMEQLYRNLAHEPGAGWCGGKETVCEEMLPFLLERGVRALLILRDPRDVLASLNHGQGRRFAGVPKPTFFNLRNWRKSVAFALHLEGHANFIWLRYEDLVSQTGAVLDRITRFLGIRRFDRGEFATGVPAQGGETWAGNSSHSLYRGVSGSSVGRHRDVLPMEVRALVEVVCRPELQRLGYPLGPPPRDPARVVRDFVEPYPMERADLDDYLPSSHTCREELSRLELLEEGTPDPDRVQEFFLFEDVYTTLPQTGGR